MFEALTEIALHWANKGQVLALNNKHWNRLDLRNKGEGDYYLFYKCNYNARGLREGLSAQESTVSNF